MIRAFEKFNAFARNRITALSVAFGVATTPAQAQPQEPLPAPAVPAESYWKTEILDTVLTVRPCAETTLCGEIRWLNPDDKKIAEYFGDPNRPEQDIRDLCGFSPKIKVTEMGSDHWSGQMEIRGWGMSVNVDATKLDDSHLRVVTSKLFVKKTETWTRVEANDPRYPKCTRPGAPK